MAKVNTPNNLTNGSTADATQVMANFAALIAQVGGTGGVLSGAGNLDGDNLSATVAAQLGLSDAATTRRAFAQIATAEATASTTPVDLATVGPSATITVPSNAFVFALCAATITGGGGTRGTVFIYQDGSALTDSNGGGPFTVVQGKDVTPVGLWLVAAPSAGSHTYKFMYSVAGGSMTFSARKLLVYAVAP